MTRKLKNVYTDKLDGITNTYSNTYHSTIKKKYVRVKACIYVDSGIESNV